MDVARGRRRWNRGAHRGSSGVVRSCTQDRCEQEELLRVVVATWRAFITEPCDYERNVSMVSRFQEGVFQKTQREDTSAGRRGHDAANSRRAGICRVTDPPL